MTLFSRVLYFSSYLPSSGGTCGDVGTSDIWGHDYLTSQPSTPFAAPVDLFHEDGIQAVVFGVGLRQLPACGTVDEGQPTDDFLGYGTTTSVSIATPNKFQLVIQTGGQTDTTLGTLPTTTFDLATPVPPLRIQSWAPLLE
jgi:hypothetical protein